MNYILLDKTRKLYKLLFKESFDFKDVSEALAQALESTVLIVDRQGNVIARNDFEGIEDIIPMENGSIAPWFSENLLDILSTHDNINLRTLGFDQVPYKGMVTQIRIANNRLGTVFAYREETYLPEDIVIAEYGTMVLSQLLGHKWEGEYENSQREEMMVANTINTLTNTEKKLILLIFKNFEGKEGTIIGKSIADKNGLQRSSVITTLRKLECAGIIETYSYGRLGTHIVILSQSAIDRLIEESESVLDSE